MKLTPVKGTNDYLPQEAALRTYLQATILAVYQSSGFSQVLTPILEDIENLDKSDGGDNLNLIFKILKRGDKFTKCIEEGNYSELADIGLRYDLTLPLSRYYANHRAKVLTPFKCIQMDKVYRAERPQKGRLREFVQCDIDILGSSSIDCEVELIHTTAKALLAIGISDFNVKINDRGLLKAVLQGVGFQPEEWDSVCITFDKLDKIGVDGVKAELLEKQFAESSVQSFLELLLNLPLSLDTVGAYCENKERIANLKTILTQVEILANGKYSIGFDLSLVRGQGYYTGTIFEIESNQFKGSIAGGGRYDNLIGKFLNETIPAVGFSIGFERIFSILSQTGYTIPNKKKKIAVFYPDNQFLEANAKADTLRAEFDVMLYQKPKKMGGTLAKLQEQGFHGFYVCGGENELTLLEK